MRSPTQIALEDRAIEKLVTTSSLRMMAQSSFRTRSTVTSTCVSRKNIKNVFNHTCVNVSKLPPLHRAKGTPAIYQPVSSRTILSSRVHSKSTRPDRRAARYVNPAQAPKTKVRCRGARDGKMSSVFGACAGLTYLAALLSGRVDLLWTRELKIVLLLTGWYIAGVPFALWRGGSFETLTHVWLKTFLIFFLLTQVLVTVERVRKLLWAIILSELVVTSFSIALSSRAIWVGERMLGFNLGILGWNFLGIAEALAIPYMAAIFVVRR